MEENHASNSTVTKAELLDLLNSGKTREVLLLCKPMGSLYELLLEQLERLEKDFELGLVEYSTMEISRNRIKYAVRNSIEQLPDGQVDMPFWKNKNLENTARKPPPDLLNEKTTSGGVWGKIKNYFQ